MIPIPFTSEDLNIVRYSDTLFIMTNIFGILAPTDYRHNCIVYYQGDYIYVVKTKSYDINSYKNNNYLYNKVYLHY